MSTPEVPKIEERESSNPGYDREFHVTLGTKRFNFSYHFFYRIQEDKAELLGRPGGGKTPTIDDEDFDAYLAEKGQIALHLAKTHVQRLHPEVKKIIVEPEVLEIGRWTAWAIQND